jgi:hypothetical protein
MVNKVTCLYLWKRWEKEYPHSSKVVEAQRRIANYEKAEWQDMIEDASVVIDKIKYLVVNNIDKDSVESSQALDYLGEHIGKYFFDPDMEYLITMNFLLRVDRDYIKFFNGFQDGLARKLADIIDVRIKQTISQSTEIMV